MLSSGTVSLCRPLTPDALPHNLLWLTLTLNCNIANRHNSRVMYACETSISSALSRVGVKSIHNEPAAIVNVGHRADVLDETRGDGVVGLLA